MSKYIFNLHYLTILGIVIIAIGTILIQKGNSIKSKKGNKDLKDIAELQKIEIKKLQQQNDLQIENSEDLKLLSGQQILTLTQQGELINRLQKDNKKLSKKAEELRFPIPNIIYADLTVDLKIDENPILQSAKKKIESLKGTYYYHKGFISLHFLQKNLTLHQEKLSIQNEIDLILDQFSEVSISLLFNSSLDKKKYLLSENKKLFDDFRSLIMEFDEINDEGKRNQIGTLVYLTKEGIFSIHYKNFPLVVSDRFPQFNSLFDFKDTTVRIDFVPNHSEQYEYKEGVFVTKRKENEIKEIEINRLVIKTNNLMFAEVKELKKSDIEQFTGKINQLIDWN